MDCRGCYTALAALHMLGLDPSGVLERSDLVSFVWRCQVRPYAHLSVVHGTPSRLPCST